MPLSCARVRACACVFARACGQLMTCDHTQPMPTADGADGPSSSGLNLEEVMKLVGVFEASFSFLLLQLVKLLAATKRKPR